MIEKKTPMIVQRIGRVMAVSKMIKLFLPYMNFRPKRHWMLRIHLHIPETPDVFHNSLTAGHGEAMTAWYGFYLDILQATKEVTKIL